MVQADPKLAWLKEAEQRGDVDWRRVKENRWFRQYHTTQTPTGPIAEMTQTFHQQSSSVTHINLSTIPSGIDCAAFDKWKAQYWQQRAASYGGGVQ